MSITKNQEEDLPPPSGHLVHPKYRPDIDGLRAVAVLSVVVYHAFPGVLKGGFVGVDIFFVISGFLISTIIVNSLERDSFSFYDFYSRRIRRIFPALLVVLISCYAFGWFALLAVEYKQLGNHIAAGAGFVSNFVLWSESGYFDAAAETKPLLHLWSLGIEEQFYIVWPLILWAAWKKRFNLFTISLVLFFVSFGLNASEYRVDSVADFYSPQTRFWELLSGALLAYISQHNHQLFTQFKTSLDVLLGKTIFAQPPTTKDTTLRDAKSIIGALFILVGLFVISKENFSPGFWALLPTLGAISVISAGAQGWANRTILSNRVLVWFGLISFPLYLWHWPLLSFAQIVESEKPIVGIRIAAVVLAVVLAWLTYRLIEKPLRFGGNGKAKTIGLLSLMIIVGCIGYETYRRDGMDFRYSTLRNSIKKFEWPKSQGANPDCIKKFGVPFKQYCSVSNVNKESSMVLLGDSNANHLYFGLDLAAKEKNLLMLGRGACLPFVGLTTRVAQGELNCQSWVEPALKYVESTKSIKTVVLSMMGAAYINKKRSMTGGFVEMHRVDVANDDDKVSIFSEGMRKTLARLTKANKEVIFVISTPRLNFLPITCIESRPFRLVENTEIKSPCAIGIQDYEEDAAQFRSVVKKVLNEFPQVKVFDSAAELCDEKLCWAMKDGKYLYRDDVHLSIEGSQFLSELLVKKLLN